MPKTESTINFVNISHDSDKSIRALSEIVDDVGVSGIFHALVGVCMERYAFAQSDSIGDLWRIRAHKIEQWSNQVVSMEE